MAPLIRSSQAPQGHTPVIRPPGRHRQKVSVAAALCRRPATGHLRLLHESFPDQYVDDWRYSQFLRQQVLGRLRGPVLLLHDRGPLHRGDFTQEVIDQFRSRLQVEEFPSYAPELNPAEQLWTWTKNEQLANFVPRDLTELLLGVEHVIKQAAGDQHRLQAFFDNTPLKW